MSIHGRDVQRLVRTGRRRPRGFTLIELIVVVALLVILAALLFPALAAARARARQATCASHLRQLALAGGMYLADYDERFPSCYRTPFGHSALDLHLLLQPYLRNWELLYCPERHTVRADCVDQLGQFGALAPCTGYGYNWGSGLDATGTPFKGDGLVRGGPRLGQVVGVLLCEVSQPGHCFFLGDTNDHDLLTLWRAAMPGVVLRGPGGTAVNGVGDPYEPPRHSGGNNFAFVDGHAQWLRFPGGAWIDGGPWVVPDMSMYSRTGQWERAPIP